MYKIRNVSNSSYRSNGNNQQRQNSNPQQSHQNSTDVYLLNCNKSTNQSIHIKQGSRLNFYQPKHLNIKQHTNLNLIVRSHHRITKQSIPIINLTQPIKDNRHPLDSNKHPPDLTKQNDSFKTNNTNSNTSLVYTKNQFQNNTYYSQFQKHNMILNKSQKQFVINKQQDFILKSQVIKDKQSNGQNNFLDQLKHIRSKQSILEQNKKLTKNHSYVDCGNKNEQLKISIQKNNNTYQTKINNFTNDGISLVRVVDKNIKKETKIYFITNLLQTWFNQQTSEKGLFEEYQNYIPSLIKSIVFAKQLEMQQRESIDKKKILLGQRPRNLNKTLIFDLDETLVHCSQNHSMHFEQIININIPEIGNVKAGLNIRPFARKVLAELRQYYEIIIFTASHESYARTILKHLCQKEELIDQCFFRDKCVMVNSRTHIKNLDIFGDRDLKDLLIIDNHLYSFSYHINNGLPILPFYSNKKDRQLQELSEFLVQMKDVDDMGQMIEEMYGFKEYSNDSNISGFIQTMNWRYRRMKIEDQFAKK